MVLSMTTQEATWILKLLNDLRLLAKLYESKVDCVIYHLSLYS